LDEQGKARHDNVEHKPVKKVVYKPRTPAEEQPVSPLEDLSNA
jgi:type VI secretion system secreted protein VgrG